MLRKIIVASALGLAFLTSFQIGNGRTSSSAAPSIKVGLATPAAACLCGPWDDMGCCR